MIRQSTILGHKQEWLHRNHLSGRDLLSLLRHTTLRVCSWSMFPTIHKGDRLEIGHASQVQIDDIVVYRQAGALVCHRVKALGPDGLIITGSDGMDRGTDAIAQRDIVGRVTSICRGRHRLPPTHATQPPLVASLHRDLDELHRLVSSRARSIVITLIDWLRSYTTTRRVLSYTLLRCLRFLIIERIPVASIPAAKTKDRAIRALDSEQTRLRIRQLDRSTHLIIQAYLGPYLVGSLNLPSGEQRLRPPLIGLGVEGYFAGLLELQPGTLT